MRMGKSLLGVGVNASVRNTNVEINERECNVQIADPNVIQFHCIHDKANAGRGIADPLAIFKKPPDIAHQYVGRRILGFVTRSSQVFNVAKRALFGVGADVGIKCDCG